MSVLKNSLLMCLQQMTKEKNWQPITRLPSPTLWLKNFTSSFLSLGSGSIQCLDSSSASNRGEFAMYPSLPKAQTPLSYTHWKHLLYFPVLTSSGCKISLWWIFCGGKGGTPGQSELSLLKHKGFPELSSLISTGFLESRDDRKQEQTHCSNKCLLTPASTALSGSSRR